MKRLTCLLLFCLANFLSARGDGFIIIQEAVNNLGPSIFPPLPPRNRPPMPPPRRYAFAPLQVTYHHVTARIEDQVAVTSVDQEFFNPNAQSLEGTYIFPIPKGGQLNKFSMEIDGKAVEAELLAADKARRIYEDIVRKMKDPALLEYAGRDVFKVRIFPIEAQAKKHITVSYTQLLTADSGLVSYAYPLNTEKFSATPLKDLSIKVELETKRALKSIYSPSHRVEVRHHGEFQATVGFEAKEVKPDTDFQLFFAPEKDAIGVKVMTYRLSDEDGFFLLLASPGIKASATTPVPKDIAFVLDTSGSMAGKKLAQAKKALQFCVENLNDDDHFELVRFSTETEPLFNRLVEATPANRARATEFVQDLRAIGGTAIDDALQKALNLRPRNSERPYIVIFLTDGLPTVGIVDENQIVERVKKAEPAGAHADPTRVFCFGIGNDVNTHLLDKITETTKAFSQYVLPDEDLEVKLSTFYTKIREPVLANLRLILPDAIRAVQTHPDPLPDLFRGEQLTVAGRYKGKGSGELVLAGTVNGIPQKFRYDVAFPAAAAEYDFIPRLWATRRVGYLLDEIRLHGENAELREEVTELARKYGIVTPYTAYLIIEDEKEHRVPLVAQSLPQLQQDRAARELSAHAWSDQSTVRSGSGAVARARYGLALKSAESPAAAVAAGNAEARRSFSATAGPVVAGQPDSAGTVTRVSQYTQQSRYIQGRNFFQNGNQWLDGQVQKMAQAKRVRVQFGSAEYFELLRREPAVSAWLALGPSVQFALRDSVYEIYE